MFLGSYNRGSRIPGILSSRPWYLQSSDICMKSPKETKISSAAFRIFLSLGHFSFSSLDSQPQDSVLLPRREGMHNLLLPASEMDREVPKGEKRDLKCRQPLLWLVSHWERNMLLGGRVQKKDRFSEVKQYTERFPRTPTATPSLSPGSL